jgi:hypothetical protein
MQKRRTWLVAPVAVLACAGAAVVDNVGPPAFVSYPILIHVGEAGADNGHFAMGPGESLTPAPLVRDSGSAAFAPARSSSGGGIGVGSEQDVSRASDSYQGETGAVSKNGLIVGGSNSIYPATARRRRPP